MLLAAVIRDIDRLQSILDLMQTHSHLIPERQAWIKKSLNEMLPGTRDFFAREQEIDAKMEELTLARRETRAGLTRLTRAYTYIGKGYVYYLEEDWLDDLEGASKLEVRAENVWRWLMNYPQVAEAIPLIDMNHMKELLDRLKEQEAGLLELQQQMQSDKADFMKREDEIDDLYHEVTQSLEGIFHEDRDLLLTFMPWRKR